MNNNNVVSIDDAKKNQPMTDAEAQAFAIAYFSRHGSAKGRGTVLILTLEKGLNIVRNEDGLWLDFATKDGLSAMIHMDMIGPQGHKTSVIQQCIDTWQKEFVEDHPDA